MLSYAQKSRLRLYLVPSGHRKLPNRLPSSTITTHVQQRTFSRPFLFCFLPVRCESPLDRLFGRALGHVGRWATDWIDFGPLGDLPSTTSPSQRITVPFIHAGSCSMLNLLAVLLVGTPPLRPHVSNSVNCVNSTANRGCGIIYCAATCCNMLQQVRVIFWWILVCQQWFDHVWPIVFFSWRALLLVACWIFLSALYLPILRPVHK